MLVYGDHHREADTARLLAEIAEACAGLDGLSGLAWHARCFDLFVQLSGLLQGWADAERERLGCDEASGAQDRLTAAAVSVAGALDRSWRSGYVEQVRPDVSALDGLARHDAPQNVALRGNEGFDFYAVYPELYLAAARDLPAGCIVIGLRSIGTALAPLVAAASGARLVATLRPVGHPFDRRVEVGPVLRDRILSSPQAVYVIVDEGPGLSGSSFGGVADWLEAEGVPRERIVFLPSHGGEPGSEASEAHRTRWRAARRLHASFERVVLEGEGGGAPLAGWFADVAGGSTPRLRDVSGGLWRRGSPSPDAPADWGREARKYRLGEKEDSVLLKFIGFGPAGQAKFERARMLGEAGFSPRPLALRHGFLAERWVEGARWTPSPRDAVDHLSRYLGFRARHFPAPAAGASFSSLARMARFNLGRCIGEDAAGARLAEWTEPRLDALQARVRPVHVDARLHAWEWLSTPEGPLKTDAVDHSRAHDLVGCQDIAWDVAGASVEFDLDPARTADLAARVIGADAAGADLTRFLRLAYLGFQAGWWSFAAEEGARSRSGFYADAALSRAWGG